MLSHWLFCKNLSRNSQLVLFLAGINFLVLMAWWVAFSPAIMSPDSLAQWLEAKTLDFGNWHPYLSSVYLAFFAKTFGTPATVAFFQIILTVIMFAYFFHFFLKSGVNRKVVVVVYLLFIFSLPVGLFTITIWKDVVFSLAVVAIAFLLSSKVEATARDWSKKEIFALLIFSLIATTFRHNGVVYVFFLPLLLFMYYREALWLKKFIFSYLLLSFFLLQLLPMMVVSHNKPFWMKAENLFAYHMSGALYANREEDMTKDLKNTLETISFDVDNLKHSYSRLYWNPLYWNENINKEALNKPAFWDALLPEFYFRNFLPNFWFIAQEKLLAFWEISVGDGYEHGLKKDTDGRGACSVEPNHIGLKTEPVSNRLNEYLGGKIVNMEINGLADMILWNLVVPLGLLVLLLILGFRKKRRDYQIFSLAILMHLPFLIVFNIAGDWRYFYFFYLSFFITIPFLFLKSVKPHKDLKTS